jgi:nucleoside 2-deoxyribosyltransferase
VNNPGEIETYIRWALSGAKRGGTMPTVYLAGPIAGCNQAEANDWRVEVRGKLANFGVVGISPLRCEPIVGERYMLNYADPKFGTARAISSKNLFDVRHCDMILAYLPRDINERRPSYGTICELAWAHVLGKPTVLVTDDPVLREHPVINVNAGWVLDTLDEAVEVLVGVLTVYGLG